MAKVRNEAPPGGGDNGPLFSGGTVPDALAADREAIANAKDGPLVEVQKPEGRRTTRGMLPELKVIHEVYGLLAELDEPQRRFVLDFINGKFPKP